MSTTSKQDRQGSRTPADLERKYDLGAMGDRFAEIMGIATDAQTHSEAALDAVEQTNSVVADLSQKVDEISITVKDLDVGTLSELSVEVGKISLSVENLNDKVTTAGFLIAVINQQSTAKISADRLDIVGKTLDIKVEATNITGKLTAEQIDVKDLSALEATIGGWDINVGYLSHSWTEIYENQGVADELRYDYESILKPRELHFKQDTFINQELTSTTGVTIRASGITWDLGNAWIADSRRYIMTIISNGMTFGVYPDISTGTLRIASN